ncbi:MAG: hypothetical protein ACI3YA_05650 [Alloprevotella sp.]
MSFAGGGKVGKLRQEGKRMRLGVLFFCVSGHYGDRRRFSCPYGRKNRPYARKFSPYSRQDLGLLEEILGRFRLIFSGAADGEKGFHEKQS